MQSQSDNPDLRRSALEAATRRVLEFLRARFRLDLWMVTRVRSGDWIVLAADDSDGTIGPGAVFAWEDSICKRTLPRGAGVVPDVALDPEARSAPIVARWGVRAYLGAPLLTADGSLFGTLCGFAREPRPELGEDDHALIVVLADLLAGFLSLEVKSIELERHNERFRFEAMIDGLTYLPNRRAWEAKLERERARALRLGETSFVSVVDLDKLESINEARGHAAGDDVLRRTALALRYAIRDSDFAARLGGDEFGLLGIQAGTLDEAEVDRRIRAALERHGILASVGTAAGGPAADPAELWQRANVAMYRNKRRRAARNERGGSAPSS